jgi:hypothetical protein
MVEFTTEAIKDIGATGSNITNTHHVELDKYKQRIADLRNKKLDDIGI